MVKKVRANTSSLTRLNEWLYRVDITVSEGSIPFQIDTIRKFEFVNHVGHHKPAYLVGQSKNKGSYQIYLNTEGMSEAERERMMDQFRTQCFSFELNSQPFFKVQGNEQKIMMFVDEVTLVQGLALTAFLYELGIEREIAMKAERVDAAITKYLEENLATILTLVQGEGSEKQILENQWIGTRLFLAGEWEFVKRLNQMAYEAGYTDEDIQYSCYGVKRANVFCVKCCSLTRIREEHAQTCYHCGTFLDISNRYSKRFDAYLGFIRGGIRRGEA